MALSAQPLGHLHFVGICGTFMAGVAAIARQLGYRISGTDANAHPPVSTQLDEQGIAIQKGFDHDPKDIAADVYIIGNVVSRGNPLMERILNQRLNYLSAPHWLYHTVLRHRHVIAVSGTHGKTTTTAMLVHILRNNSNDCGFLIGGIPGSERCSAALGSSDYFVIEADEYDTAFFDKNAKFLHYRPRTLIINNLEFDHSDMYPSLDAVIAQFHRLLRQVPSRGLLICPPQKPIEKLIDMGCWSEIEWLGTDWRVSDKAPFLVHHKNQQKSALQLPLAGAFNRHNAVAAIAAAHHAGVAINAGITCLRSFSNVKRRQQFLADIKGVQIYDDFAHHPNAIAATLEALREQGVSGRLWAVFEPASNSMVSGTHKDGLYTCFEQADEALLFDNGRLKWPLEDLRSAHRNCFDRIGTLVDHLATNVTAGDVIVIMSNGPFAGAHQRIIDALRRS